MCPEPETIPSNITTLVEIGVECRNVEAPNGVSVRNGGTLKIAPGTTVSFASGAGLQIDEGGIIEAIGSADAPITLKGREDVPGFWKGLILYRAASTQNQLAHVIIESAGSSPATYASVTGAITVQSASRLRVTDSVLRKNKGYGIVLDGSELTTFSNNTLSDNTLGAAYTSVDSVGQLPPENNYVGNAVDVVRIAGGSLTTPIVLHDLGVPYLAGSIDVRANGRLTIEPGVEIHFEAGKQLYVEGGVLEARGTASRPIILAGAETVPGFWKGVGLYKAPSTENILDYVHITDAGSSPFTYASHGSSIYISDALDLLTIRNTTVDRGKGFGLLVRSRARLPGFENNVLTGHELGAASLYAESAEGLDQGSSFTGNAVGKDFVLIRGGELAQSSTWRALNVPYRVEGTVSVTAGGHLTIGAGVEVQFAGSSALEITSTTSKLSILGTEDARVRLTRTSDSAFWKGVRLYQSTNDNRIEYTDISYGGASPFTYFSAGQGANLAVHNAWVTFQSVLLQNGNNYGLAVNSGNQLTHCDELNYSDNASGETVGTLNCN